MADDDIPEADELYRAEPGEFVAARNELARRLRTDGRRDDAAVVAKLRRPTPTAWALNQVARDRPELIDAALEAGARLRQATDDAVAGDASTLRAVTLEDRTASGAVVDAAAAQLGAKGTAAKSELAATVRAAVLDEGVAAELRRGVLTTDHDASGFGLSLGAEIGDLAAARARRTKRQENEQRDPEAEALEREARRRQAELEQTAQRLERRAERLIAVADRAEDEAKAARTEADAAAEEAAAARRAVDDDG